MHTSRRSFLTGLASLLAAPTIVRAGTLMAISPLPVASAFDLGASDCTALNHYVLSREQEWLLFDSIKFPSEGSGLRAAEVRERIMEHVRKAEAELAYQMVVFGSCMTKTELSPA